MDIIEKVPQNQLYELFFDKNSLYIITPFSEEENNSLLILYPLSDYTAQLTSIQKALLLKFLLLSFLSALISLLFSFYALSPLKASILLLEEFIKDIIHDLNTPITSILINLKMMQKDEETQSIEQSAKAIAMLHQNLESYLNNSPLQQEEVMIKSLIEEQVALFKPLYAHLEWKIELTEQILKTNKNALNRILYNLISNACKYNTSKGFIEISNNKHKLNIINSSYGVKHPHRVFERFYKEQTRGLGIGLHIVKKLCETLGLKIFFQVEEQIVEVNIHF